MTGPRLLVACETSGRVREAFRARGVEAWSCDLLPADDGSPFHYQCDVRDILNERWDGMIAHPDCTYLCASGLHWIKRGRIEADGRPRAAHRDDALAFVRLLLQQYPRIPHVALENSRGCIGTHIAPYTQSIQPWQFGEDASKATDLWLRGLPPLKPTRYVPPRLVCNNCRGITPHGEHRCRHCGAKDDFRPRWANQTDSGQNRLGPSADRWKLRAQTYRGIADAMADQWTPYLLT